MNAREKRNLADRIALEHGCELQPTAFSGTALMVMRKYQQGSPLDEARLSKCIAELEAAGVKPRGLVS